MSSSPSVTRSLKVALEEVARATFGPRYVLCELDDSGDLVKSEVSARSRSNEWRVDLKNVQKHFEKDPLLVAFFAPRQTTGSPIGGRGDREVFKGHGFKSGGLPDFLTSSQGNPSAANINRSWKKHGNNHVTSSSSGGTKAMIVAHMPDGASADVKAKYTAAKSVLKAHLKAEIHSATEHRHTSSFGSGATSSSYKSGSRGGVDYGSSGAPHRRAATQFVRSSARSDGDKHVAKLRTADGPLNLWEQAAIQSEIDARQIARETPKQGGFLAAMHETGGIMGVPVANEHDVVEELRGVVSAPTSPRSPMNIQSIVREANKAQPDWAKTADKMVKAHRSSSDEYSNSGSSTPRSVSFGTPRVSNVSSVSSSRASSNATPASASPRKDPSKTPAFAVASEKEKPFSLDGAAAGEAAALVKKHRRTRSKTEPLIIGAPKIEYKGGRPVMVAKKVVAKKVVAAKPTRKPVVSRTRTPKSPPVHEKAAPEPAKKTVEAASPNSATKRAASPAKPKREERIFLDEWAYSIDMPQAGAVLRKAGCETLDDVKKHADFTAEELEDLGLLNEAHRFKLLYLIEKLKK